MILIIANILSFIGNALFTFSSLLKSKKKILLFQSANHVLSSIAEILTSAYSGVVQEAVALIRNFSLLFIDPKNKKAKIIITIICVLIAVVVGVLINYYFSDNVWYGYFPVIATVVYSTGITLAMVSNFSILKTEFIIKITLILNCILWIIYGYIIMLYPVIIFNALTIILSIISIVRIIVIVIKEKRANKISKINETL